MAQSKSSNWKAKLSMTERGYHMDGYGLHARLCACSVFLWSQIMCQLYKTLSHETINHKGPPWACKKITRTCYNDPVVRVGDIRKHQNNPECTKSQ